MTPETFLNDRVTLWCADMRDALKRLEENSVDSVVCDPPYHLTSIVKRFGAENAAPAKAGKTGAYARASAGFMGKQWDGGDIAFQIETWREVYRVLKPGGHLVAFSGTRTYHRMACAIEDAGFEIRDSLQWLYGSGFPKSHDVAKQIDKAAGIWRGRAGAVTIAEQVAKGTEYERTEKGEAATPAPREWDGWGTALKPACEPIVLARKSLSESTVVANVLKWGTGAINVGGCRVGTTGGPAGTNYAKTGLFGLGGRATITELEAGRWPANIIHDGSAEVVEAFPDSEAGVETAARGTGGMWSGISNTPCGPQYGDSGSAARFFYTAKADSDDRLGSKHPTVKPVDLIQYLVRLVTPPKGLVLDCFAGTGTTGEAAYREGFSAILIEREPEYQADIRRRMELVLAGPDTRLHATIKAKGLTQNAGPLFGGVDEKTRGGADRFTDTSPIKTNDWPGRAQVVNE